MISTLVVALHYYYRGLADGQDGMGHGLKWTRNNVRHGTICINYYKHMPYLIRVQRNQSNQGPICQASGVRTQGIGRVPTYLELIDGHIS